MPTAIQLFELIVPPLWFTTPFPLFIASPTLRNPVVHEPLLRTRNSFVPPLQPTIVCCVSTVPADRSQSDVASATAVSSPRKIPPANVLKLPPDLLTLPFPPKLPTTTSPLVPLVIVPPVRLSVPVPPSRPTTNHVL